MKCRLVAIVVIVVINSTLGIATVTETAIAGDLPALLTRAGLTTSQQTAITQQIDRWRASVASGQGSPDAVHCFDRTAALESCVQAAAKDGDDLGRGLLRLLTAFAAIERQNLPLALTRVNEARDLLLHELDPQSELRPILHAASGVLLAAAGQHAAAIDHTARAIALERQIHGDGLFEIAILHYNLGTSEVQLSLFDNAATSFIEAHRILALHPGSKLYRAACLGSLGALELQRSDAAAALPYFEQTVTLTQAAYGQDHPAVAIATGNLAECHRQLGAFRQARQLFEQALSICESKHGPTHQQTAVYLERLASVLAEIDENKIAIEHLTRAVSIRAGAFGESSTELAQALAPLATAHQKQGDVAAARQLLERALAINLNLAPESLATSAALGRLGELEREVGNYAIAKEYYQQALAMHIELQGESHQDVAAVLLNQANLQRDAGEVAAAKRGYERAMAIYTVTVGENHQYMATALTNLAALLQNTGDLKAAIPATERAINIYLATVGPNHPWLAVALNNLALMYKATDQAALAVPLFEQAVEIWAHALGPQHQQTAIGLNNLAVALLDEGRLTEARPVLDEALLASRSALGPNHPQVAKIIATRAGHERLAGDRARARSSFEQALEILEAAVGPDHPDVATLTLDLAHLIWQMGETDSARHTMQRGFQVFERTIEPLLEATSERERIALIRSRRWALDGYLTLFDRPEDAASTYLSLLRWKGVVQNTLAAQRFTVLASRQPELEQTFSELATVRRQLAMRVFEQPNADRRAERESDIIRLTQSKEQLERELAASSSEFRQMSSLTSTSVELVCQELQPNEILLDYFLYNRLTSDSESWVPSYTVFILEGGACSTARRIELGEAKAIDRAIDRYRGLLEQLAPNRMLSKQASRLRQQLWDPIEPLLSGRTRIWIAPDGSLNGLPFTSLVDRNGRYLVETLTISQLTSGNDLRRASVERPESSGLLIAGAIDYGQLADQADPKPTTRRAPPKGVLGRFKALPATAAEIDQIVKSLDLPASASIVRLSGAAATESELREAVTDKAIIHLATHGFFATGRVRSSLAAVPSNHARWVLKGEPQAGHNPMLLSGVVLAGANHRGDEADDGLLTAEEVAGLDLRGAELVTLSACETGLGDLRSGEGVMGLRRAFTLAGAQALVMSLWTVSDEHTKSLMGAFYEQLANQPGGDKAQALRTAQLQLIHSLRTTNEGDHPFYWAAFVISGR